MKPLKVSGISPDDSLEMAAGLMLDLGTDALPVISGGQLVGIIRLADLLIAPPPSRSSGRTSEHREEQQVLEILQRSAVGRFVNEEVIAVTEETPLMQAAALMLSYDRQRLLVLRNGTVSGMLSRADVIAALLKEPRKLALVAAGDVNTSH